MSYLFTVRTRTGEIEQFISESAEFTLEINGVPVVGVHHTEDGGACVGIYPDTEHFQTLEVITMPGSKDVKDMGFDELLGATIPKVPGMPDKAISNEVRENAELIPLTDPRRPEGCVCILIEVDGGWKLDAWNPNCKTHPQLEDTKYDVSKEELDAAKFPARHTFETQEAFDAALAKGKPVLVDVPGRPIVTQPGETFTTKSGKVLTSADIDKMAEEDGAYIDSVAAEEECLEPLMHPEGCKCLLMTTEEFDKVLNGADLLAAEDVSGAVLRDGQLHELKYEDEKCEGEQ